MKTVFWLVNMVLTQISRSRSVKQSRISMLIQHIYVLGRFVNFWVIFRYIWRKIVFLKGLVKFTEIRILKIWCFPPFNPSLNFLKFHLNSCLAPP